jgi:hypothetical protein
MPIRSFVTPVEFDPEAVLAMVEASLDDPAPSIVLETANY